MMEIGSPTNVRHVAHVTFDRFHGFLGLPVEFEPEVPQRAPSASASVFGVSSGSMQCSFDSRGNSVPTILLLMQRRLYEQGGLRAEGIFRINAGNGQEEFVRDQLNSGIVPDGIDVHCLAGLIKAWFRELPTGVLDPLDPEQVMQSQSEAECAQLVKLLPPTEAALLDWAINLMSDVVQDEPQNKMNARNVAMVFAPNMTQMADPLTALMYAVKVMDFLKTLILMKLKERQESTFEDSPIPQSDPSDENGHHSPQFHVQACTKEATKPDPDTPDRSPEEISATVEAINGSIANENAASEGTSANSTEESRSEDRTCTDGRENTADDASTVPVNSRVARTGISNGVKYKKGTRKASSRHSVRSTLPAEKSRGVSIVSRINSNVERVEAWR